MITLRQTLKRLVSLIALIFLLATPALNTSDVYAEQKDYIDVTVYHGDKFDDESIIGKAKLEIDTGVWYDREGRVKTNIFGAYKITSIASYNNKEYLIQTNTVSIIPSGIPELKRFNIGGRWVSQYVLSNSSFAAHSYAIYDNQYYFGGEKGDELADKVRDIVDVGKSENLPTQPTPPNNATKEESSSKSDISKPTVEIESKKATVQYNPDISQPLFINFGKDNITLDNHIQDNGQAKSIQENGIRYGWNNNHSKNIVNRSEDQWDKKPFHNGVQGFARLSKGIDTDLNWSADLKPNSTYRVEVITGDAATQADSRHHILANGIEVADCKTSSDVHWCESSKIIQTDGSGTIRIESGSKANDAVLNLIRFYPVS